MDRTRRNFLAAAGVATLGLMSGAARAQTSTPCFDPAALPLSQKNQRRSLSYTSPSPDQNRRCGLCAFFTAGEGGQCGACQILSGGPVEAGAVCTSFAARS